MQHRHLLIISSEFPPLPGGIGTHAYHLAKHLSFKGYKVRVIADQRSWDVQEELAFDAELSFDVIRVPLRKVRGVMYAQRLQLLFESMRWADVVLASGKFSLWSVAFMSNFVKRPLLAVVHGTEVNFKNPLLRYSIQKSLGFMGQIISVSKFTKRLLPGYLQRRTTVIPNGIEKAWGREASKVKEFKGSPKLITVGHVSERKGQLHVIRALPRLLASFPNLHYHCVGLATAQEPFEQEAKALGVLEHVSFHGRVSEEELQGMLKTSNVFVMLSGMTQSGDVEGFGIAILEANVLGIPAIGTKECGISDAIVSGRTGELVTLGDMEGLSQALQRVLGDYDAYSKAAKGWALKHDWNMIVERYISVIEREIGNKT
ncbi:glycosyltransferase family 4 protein [Mangrovimonas sp. YM274]|uniref:glycosyltransferase family 4 protein n=1 Tax=Mangrovimonas sp. YM274 TaxID=3070660 RepID=UPI0027DDBEB3|nr:glycosyltransferase family 4 protein [Mangrovimonas sp. YM274]WMI69862.1 glycosyltransferase family 4 protein [Mangrovimonas sp. YM274]